MKTGGPYKALSMPKILTAWRRYSDPRSYDEAGTLTFTLKYLAATALEEAELL